MPVARNLSLPSAIEARKFKKRPDELHELKHCHSMPNKDNVDSGNVTVTDSCAKNNGDLKNVAEPMQFLSSEKESTASKENHSSAPRGTLSQPCLSESASVGATSIFPHLFLGSQNDVSDESMMKENGITNVLNVSCKCAKPPHVDERRFRRIPVRDNYQEKITPHLDEAVSFIESARMKNERVLVHCLAGVSRSATVAIAYVMYYLGLTFDEAYRFVKEKRPTISPNFNFLGQLMEFEAHLRQTGRVSKPQTTNADRRSLTPAPSPAPRPAVVPKIEVASPKASEQDAKSLIKPAKLTHPGQKSSFCRRRKGPALNMAFASRTVHVSSAGPHTSDCTGCSKERSFHGSNATPGGAGVILDLKVSVPASDHPSGRLGSDGRDIEVDDDAENFTLPVTTPYNHDARKTHSLPRYLPGLAAAENHRLHRAHSALTPGPEFGRSDKFIGGQRLMAHLRNARSATAPSTPALSRLGKASRDVTDVDMNDVEEIDIASPPSPQSSRCRSLTDPKELFLSSLDKGRASPSSPHSDSFMSRKTRSPKVLKKSFNLNVRPMYGYQAFLTTKHNLVGAQVGPGVRSKLQDPAANQLVRSRSDNCVMAMHCESPNADGLSSLTLSSPVSNKDDPLLIVGKKCLQVPLDRLAKPTATSSPTTRGIVTPNSVKVCTNGTSEPFRLVSGTELKPRWRNRHRSPKKSNADPESSASVRTNATATAAITPASTVLTHCNGVEMISCS